MNFQDQLIQINLSFEKLMLDYINIYLDCVEQRELESLIDAVKNEPGLQKAEELLELNPQETKEFIEKNLLEDRFNFIQKRKNNIKNQYPNKKLDLINNRFDEIFDSIFNL